MASHAPFRGLAQMADIFISYSKGSAAQTEQLAKELRADRVS
jgi:hypothetical protein